MPFSYQIRRRGIFWVLSCTLVVSVLVLFMLVEQPAPQPSNPAVFPGEHWTWKTPEDAGFSSRKLASFSQKYGGIGCIVHGGEMIHSWGRINRRTDVASSAKPFYTHFVLKAIENGLIESLETPVLQWVPQLGALNPALGYKDRAITFHHLLSQTSGYGLIERPGEAFAYNDYATGLLVWTLFDRVYGLHPNQYNGLLNGPELGETIGFQDMPTLTHPNSIRGRLRISVRDMARFALLYLHQGHWEDKILLREDLFNLALREPLPPEFPITSGQVAESLAWVRTIGGGKDEKGHGGSLGYFWWFNRTGLDGTHFFPDAPPNTFVASGYGGLFAMVVIPELDLVVVWNIYDKYNWVRWSPFDQVGRHHVNDMIRELMAARTHWFSRMKGKVNAAKEKWHSVRSGDKSLQNEEIESKEKA
jgi:CubicO group peptidase (beta-lactamase class C family)